MMWKQVILVVVIHQVALSLGGGVVWYMQEIVPAVDTCINSTITTSPTALESILYKCNENGVLKYTFDGVGDCTPNENSSTSCETFGGCSAPYNGNFYEVKGCSTAQAQASPGGCRYTTGSGDQSDSDVYYPINLCVNDAGTFSSEIYRSYKFECREEGADSDVAQVFYSEADCPDSNYTNNDTYTPDFSTCDGGRIESCGVILNTYGYGNFYCSPANDGENTKYGAPSDAECNYLSLVDDPDNNVYSTGTPYQSYIATGVCFKSRRGYYEWSQKYVCADDENTVSLWYYIDSTDCDEGGSKFESNRYDKDDYHFRCSGSSCSGTTYTEYYDDACRPSYFDQYPAAYGTCVRAWGSPTYNDRRIGYSYYSTARISTCFGDSPVDFFYINDNCTGQSFFDPGWVYSSDWAEGCFDNEMSGCSNSEYKENGGSVLAVGKVFVLFVGLVMVLSM